MFHSGCENFDAKGFVESVQKCTEYLNRQASYCALIATSQSVTEVFNMLVESKGIFENYDLFFLIGPDSALSLMDGVVMEDMKFIDVKETIDVIIKKIKVEIFKLTSQLITRRTPRASEKILPLTYSECRVMRFLMLDYTVTRIVTITGRHIKK